MAPDTKDSENEGAEVAAETVERVVPPRARQAAARNAGRYTPPPPKIDAASPLWVPTAMFTFLGVGALTVVLNYLNLLPGDFQNSYLMLGLVSIIAGFMMATQYR